jgi:hypothetical protein
VRYADAEPLIPIGKALATKVAALRRSIQNDEGTARQ